LSAEKSVFASYREATTPHLALFPDIQKDVSDLLEEVGNTLDSIKDLSDFDARFLRN